MKTLELLFLLIYLSSIQTSAVQPISNAIAQVIRKFYTANSMRFDFIISAPKNANKFGDIINAMAKITSDVSPYKLIQIDDSEKSINVTQSAILFFDDIESYNKFHQRVLLANDYPRLFYFLVCFANEGAIDDPKNLHHNEEMIFQETFLRLDGNSFGLWTFKMFQQPNCRDVQQKQINKYSQGSRKWRSHKFFVEKFNNLNGCELVVEIYDSLVPVTIVDHGYNDKVIAIRGYGIDFNKQISKYLNYTSSYVLLEGTNDTKIPEGDFILAALSSRVLLHKMSSFDMTHSFTTSEIFILISRRKPYTQFEKMFLPFEIEVWTWLIITLTIAVVTILVIKLTPQEIQNVVFGERVGAPILNLV